MGIVPIRIHIDFLLKESMQCDSEGPRMTAQMQDKAHAERLLVAVIEECYQAKTREEYLIWNLARVWLQRKIIAMGRGK